MTPEADEKRLDAAWHDMLQQGLNRAEQRELEALAELDEAKAEIARLRKIEEAARDHGLCTCRPFTNGNHHDDCDADPALRAALGEEAP